MQPVTNAYKAFSDSLIVSQKIYQRALGINVSGTVGICIGYWLSKIQTSSTAAKDARLPFLSQHCAIYGHRVL